MNEESKILGVSLRGWIALIIVYTVCLMSIYSNEVREPLYTLCTTAVGFYFGSKSSTKTQPEVKEQKDVKDVA